MVEYSYEVISNVILPADIVRSDGARRVLKSPRSHLLCLVGVPFEVALQLVVEGVQVAFCVGLGGGVDREGAHEVVTSLMLT